MDKKVWYFSDSPAASLIGALPPGYTAKAVSRTRPFSTPPQIQLVWLADLVLLDANPLEDIRNTQSIWRVIKGGWLFDPEKLRPPVSTSPDE